MRKSSKLRSAESKRRSRLKAIAVLGGRCAYCGIDDPIVLNIDHVKDDGGWERASLNPSQICARIASGSVPKGRYQLLCCNCNWRKEYLRRTAAETMVAPGEPRSNQNDSKTVCIHGHPFTEENTYRDKRGHRMCKACNRRRTGEYAKRIAEAAQVYGNGGPQSESG